MRVRKVQKSSRRELPPTYQGDLQDMLDRFGLKLVLEGVVRYYRELGDELPNAALSETADALREFIDSHDW